jgi:peptide/nickel transport system permease protein
VSSSPASRPLVPDVAVVDGPLLSETEAITPRGRTRDRAVLRIVLERLLWAIPLMFIVSALTFFLAWLTPGNAARTILGSNDSPQAYAQLEAQLGLNKPLPVQYWTWLSHAVRGNLGSSVFTGQSVTSILNQRLPVTLSLVAGAVLISLVLGVGLGLWSALRGGVAGRLVDGISLLGVSLPTPWLGLIFIILFAIKLHWLPATGYVPFGQSTGQWLEYLVLPVLCLAAVAIPTIGKQTRGAMIDELGREYIRALRANGLPTRRIILRHALKNAALPVLSVLGVLVIWLLGGTVIVEDLFALPGLGQEVVSATAQHDLPVLEGVVVYFTLIVVAVNLLIDLAYSWLNPKVVTG